MINQEPRLVEDKDYFHIIFPCGFEAWYSVKEERKNFFAIFLYHWGEEKFLTHRTNQKSACKVAKLLQKAYIEGAESEKP